MYVFGRIIPVTHTETFLHIETIGHSKLYGPTKQTFSNPDKSTIKYAYLATPYRTAERRAHIANCSKRTETASDIGKLEGEPNSVPKKGSIEGATGDNTKDMSGRTWPFFYFGMYSWKDKKKSAFYETKKASKRRGRIVRESMSVFDGAIN
ncbi:hypothetical protein BCR43DRAFT_501903 [Syncephalastrum racemosum]|uniref:Uncharacterized protein n=1 Tax=Syncephalastrum racemosum TaxID=13706 RepID=A0A1X2HKZ1_SYNRA|nr:hypothetical protein BCR43DRAFT_501903 [Syncephalastrum racemosum]